MPPGVPIGGVTMPAAPPIGMAGIFLAGALSDFFARRVLGRLGGLGVAHLGVVHGHASILVFDMT